MAIYLRIAAACLDWLYPPVCMACKTLLPLNAPHRTAIRLCESCESLFEPSPDPAIAPFTYEGILRDIIRDIKFRHRKNHARALGRLWARYMPAPCEPNAMGRIPPMSFSDTTLVPMPLHPNKQRARGFNQAELLAQELSRAWRMPTENTLRRVIDTPPQAGLHPARRKENVADAFQINPSCTVAGKSFILIDDIYTTGASMNECIRTLQNSGAQHVTALTLALTKKKPRDDD